MLEVVRDILQSRYLRSNVAHKQSARASLKSLWPLWREQLLKRIFFSSSYDLVEQVTVFTFLLDDLSGYSLQCSLKAVA